MKRNIYTISLVFRFLNVCDILVGELLPTLATARRLRLNGWGTARIAIPAAKMAVFLCLFLTFIKKSHDIERK